MRIFGAGLFIILWGCSTEHSTSRLFTNVTPQTRVQFVNALTYTKDFNPYTYRNFYNGAGVAVGDINNDGLLDIYFAGNQVDNKLYVNKGNLTFQDITESAGVACHDVWSTGVTFVDINADGLLDIYVCKSGNPDVPHRNNELFINNGDLTFTESSKKYGLDVVGLSVQAAFFDYDKDGDLDCYLLTNSFKSVGNYDLIENQRDIPDPLEGGNKFFINDNGKFIDYSEKAGIYRSSIGFGLGITLGDFNKDSWPDIFVSNDFFERDYLYINDQHGGFVESLTSYFNSISMGSMGADFADLDNDGNPELFVTEMLPDSLSRRKTKTTNESWDKYSMNVKNGYHHQFSRNVLQKKTDSNRYAEIGRLAGLSASEWSWGALLFDMNNDGKKDIFIANGIYKDLLDRDYLTYTGAADNVRKIIKEDKENAILKLIDLMPSSKFRNYVFMNEGDLKFKDVAVEWGFDEAAFSNGSAYGDLDNDGDLDLVINNLNGSALVYRNNSDSSIYKSIGVALSMSGNNTFSVGSEVTAFCGKEVFFTDNFVTRGFESSVQPFITLGVGSAKAIDSLLIKWPDNGYTILYNIRSNQKLKIRKEDMKLLENIPWRESDKPIQWELLSKRLFKHEGSKLVDFNRDRLLPMMFSNETPALVKGDINRDGIEEIYIGGGKNQSGSFIRFKSGKFENFIPAGIGLNALPEETKGTLVDVDNDGDLDFYMAAGGRFFSQTSSALMDKIFLNDGVGNFSESPYPLPFTTFISTSVSKSIDFDKDGDMDLLVAARFDPFNYGIGGRAFLLENDGKGLFIDVTKTHAPDLINLGMITDMSIQDIDLDGLDDIILVGDWMPIVILKNTGNNFVNVSKDFGLTDTEGWWHTIESGDFNKDGKIDFVLGNQGLNSFFKKGDRMYVNDFDRNGSVEQIYCTKIRDKYYPLSDRDEILSQLPSLKKTLLYYKDYAKKSIDELFSESILSSSKIFQVNMLSSILLLSDSKGYKKIELPLEGQYSPIYAMQIVDVDNDGVDDIIAGGNQYQVKPQFGRYDASNAWFFKGMLNEKDYILKPGIDLNVKGQIRDIECVEIDNVKYIFFAKHDDDLEIYKISN
jgi:enediyne biosynthesis protein E4